MRPILGFAAALFACLPAGAEPARVTDPHMLGQYRARRVELRKSLADGIIVLFGRGEHDEDLRSGFFQESNFYYLTGWQEPGAILLLAPVPDDSHAPGYAARERLPREILFLPERNSNQEKWTGRKIGPDEQNVREMTGFDAVMPAERFEAELLDVLQTYTRIYTLEEQAASTRLKQLAPLRAIASAAPAIAKLRMSKSPEEIALIQHATDVTLEARAQPRIPIDCLELRRLRRCGATMHEVLLWATDLVRCPQLSRPAERLSARLPPQCRYWRPEPARTG